MNPIIITEHEEQTGRVAYAAYFKARAGRNFHDAKLLPTYEELGPQNQKAWAAVAAAFEPPAVPDLDLEELTRPEANG